MGKVTFGGGKVGMSVPVALPSGYTKLAYIQSSGTQYIDTGYVVSSENLRVVIKFKYTASHSDTTIFGSETSGITGSGEYSICPYGDGPYFFVGGSKQLSAGSTSLNTNYTLDVTAKNGLLTAIWNGTSYSVAYTDGLNHTYPIAIFGNNVSGNVSQLCTIALSYMQIYDNDVLVRDFIPCINASGSVGLYDLVSKAFYANAGSGTFIGSEVA